MLRTSKNSYVFTIRKNFNLLIYCSSLGSITIEATANTIEYQINRAPHTVRACHYKECQNRSGSTFGLTMVVDKDSFPINGEITSYIRTSDSSQKITSYFFPKCGNSIYGELEKFPDIIAVRLGTLDNTKWFTA